MAIVKMKKLRLIGLTEEREQLLSTLLRLGCVEVTEPEAEDPEWAQLLHKDEAEDFSELRSRINGVNEALATMKRYASKEFPLFEKRAVVREQELFSQEQQANALQAAEEINQASRQIARLLSRENKLENLCNTLEPWRGWDLPLEVTGTQTAVLLLGSCPGGMSVEKMHGVLLEAFPLCQLTKVLGNKEHQYLAVLCRKEEGEKVDELLRQFLFTPFRPKELLGTATENLDRLAKEMQACKEERAALAEKIRGYRTQCHDLKVCTDRLNQDFARAEVRTRLMTNGRVLSLNGWVPEPAVQSLQQELKNFCCATEFEDPGEDDVVPTLLKNPKWMRCINMVTEMYSLPEYRHGIDPNPLIFLVYIIFFGFMFADIAYGIIIFLASFLITKKFKPKKTMGYMFQLGQYLGISTTIFGVLTGGFFGDFLYEFTTTFTPNHVITLPALINPLQSPMQILTIAIVMGCIHLVFGQIVHIYMEARDGHPMEGILDVVPWWLVFAGIGLFAWKGTAVGIAVGFLALLLTQGRHKKGFFGKLFGGVASWYDITSWLGDVLSYSRLMALMLATTVIAQVMNILGTLPHNIVVFFLIFLIGHVFNIGINLIGTYVHAARLQYLEFFTKFYKEGGVPFRPLQFDTKYVDVAEQTEEVV